MLICCLALLTLCGCDEVKEYVRRRGSAERAAPVPTAKASSGPAVVLRGGRVLVDGKPVADYSVIAPGERVGFRGLIAEMEGRRDDWRLTHPHQTFPGRASLEAADDVGGNVFLSAFDTMAFTGHTQIAVRIKVRDVWVQAPVAPPTEIDAKQVDELHKELHVVLRVGELRMAMLHGYVELSSQNVARKGALHTQLQTLVADKLKLLDAEQSRVPIFLHAGDTALPLQDILAALAALSSASKKTLRAGSGSVGLTTRTEPLYEQLPFAKLEREELVVGSDSPPAPPGVQRAFDKSAELDHKLRAEFWQMRRCYEQALAKDLSLEGSLDLHIVVGEGGKVSDATAVGALTDAELRSCITGVVKTIAMDRLSGMTFFYPMVLTPRPSGPAKPAERGAAGAGRLPREVIQRVVRANFRRFRQCYESGLRTKPDLKGRVKVRFVIGRDGKVSNVGGGGDLPDPEVINCITKAFYSLVFPKPDGGIVTVAYPIVFQPN